MIAINGTDHCARLTLGALAMLEEELGEGSLLELAQRFENGRFSGADVLAVLVAGLRGAGWQGTRADLLTAEIAGGPMGAARAAATLLARAFGDGSDAP